ncbi:hypothetical protein AAU61_03250 [Desulfocarbo indianensis]|nr:hypothetical protein AAU61_03250 [Desulfocarbo indianensis]
MALGLQVLFDSAPAPAAMPGSMQEHELFAHDVVPFLNMQSIQTAQPSLIYPLARAAVQLP